MNKSQIFSFFKIVCICEYLCASVWPEMWMSECLCIWSPEENFGFPEARVTGRYEQ